MHPERLGFFARLWLAFVLPWQILFNAALAARVAAARSPQAHPDALPEPQDDGVLVVDDPTDLPPIVPELVPEPHPATPAEPAGPDHTAALLLLSILQREGRFVDFLQEDVTDFGDADVGAAARVVHEGCKRALAQYLDIAPVRPEAEGAPITLPPGFDPTENRVTGNVTGEPPYRGRLAHPGWRVRGLDLPTVAPGHDASVIAPAEIEL
ncbi:MAG: DUF2760 domain-containing protein [Myxococcales bacterium]|nr:DUF2760 domain-containing protein [Myxococcales bacterium]MCB9550759.1 DUF2760 domain-containing protein [Myxococcales bacterium]